MKSKGLVAEEASAALFGLVPPTCQITAYQGFGDSPSQPGNGPPTQFHASLKGYGQIPSHIDKEIHLEYPHPIYAIEMSGHCR